ncbi:hypothetical protein CDAR_525471 [Caerostris darwini]|uniref:Uncharacterized protein n=1 Tax=Caerostris darwini TaxID=1538125 RepID=A0AAV4RNN5_9ARAC|nr:hypothetical protein CDAR_525471 [Caerostris darwini]
MTLGRGEQVTTKGGFVLLLPTAEKRKNTRTALAVRARFIERFINKFEYASSRRNQNRSLKVAGIVYPPPAAEKPWMIQIASSEPSDLFCFKNGSIFNGRAHERAWSEKNRQYF